MPAPDELAHLPDEAVAVEILGRVLIDEAIAIAVVRAHVRSQRLRRVVVERRAVGIVDRLGVQGLRVHEPGDRRVLAVVAEDVVHEVQGGLDARDLARVPPALEEERRLVGGLPRPLVRDRDLPDVPALERAADRVELHEVRIPRRPHPQQGRRLLVGVVVLEVHLAFPKRLELRVVRAREGRRAVARPAAHAIERALSAGRLLPHGRHALHRPQRQPNHGHADQYTPHRCLLK